MSHPEPGRTAFPFGCDKTQIGPQVVEDVMVFPLLQLPPGVLHLHAFDALVVEEAGLGKLLAIHPDENVMMDVFGERHRRAHNGQQQHGAYISRNRIHPHNLTLVTAGSIRPDRAAGACDRRPQS